MTLRDFINRITDKSNDMSILECELVVMNEDNYSWTGDYKIEVDTLINSANKIYITISKGTLQMMLENRG